MRARTLKHLITLEQKTLTSNEFGETKTAYSDFASVYASIEQIKDNEKFLSNQIHQVSTRKFRIRYLPGVTLDMRIKYNNKTYEIVEIINPFESNIELLLLVNEVF